ncbi:MAG TPA: response regulator [Blastocatellia bacterium]|nr:response regulator [Blastocatellia bacterium]
MTTSNVKKKHVLFVGDDEDTQELVKLTLPAYGIVIARDFTEGLRIARQRRFDLYVLDNWLPDGTGVELCRCIREFDRHTPVLFYSAPAYECDAKEALSAGAQIYMTKSSNLDELEWAVSLLISIAHGRASEAWQAERASVREELAIQSG